MRYADFHEWHRAKIENPSGTDGQERMRIYLQPQMIIDQCPLGNPVRVEDTHVEHARVVLAHLRAYGVTHRQISLLTVKRSCWTMHPFELRMRDGEFLSGERSRLNKTVRRVIYDTPYRVEL